MIEGLAIAIIPVALSEFVSGNPASATGPVQREAGNRCAIVHQARAVRHQQCHARRSAIAQQPRFGTDALDNLAQRHELGRPLRFEGEKLGRSAIGILAKDPLLDDGQLVGHQRLNPSIECAGLARRIDPRLDQSEEFIEDGILQGDGQREDTVEPALDRREIVGEAALLLKLQAGALAEIGKSDAGELALMQQVIPAVQRLAGVIALEVVGRIEQVLPTRLPLAACERAKRIEAAGDGRDETALTAAIGGDGAKHRRRGLMGAVGTSKPLDGAFSAPARLQQEMHPALLVLGVQTGVIRAARAAGI